MRVRLRLFALPLLAALGWCVSAAAQESAAAKSPLDELLDTPISTAAKYDQPMNDVAASVTIFTAEEIARNGWYTLADALSSSRGVYTTYDRAYTYLGVRGVGLPSDYNDRILVLLDGVPLLENVSGSVGIGTMLAIDLSNFSRIEFIRGPGSVLYGTTAMFGVINLITKDAGERSSITAGVGSGGLATAAAHGGRTFGDLKVTASLSWQESAGKTLYYPEFDRPETNDGVVRKRDYDDYHSLLATAAWRDLRLLVLSSNRYKGVPTGSWGTVFGADQKLTDGRQLIALDWTRQLGVGKNLSARIYRDDYVYRGIYPIVVQEFADRTDSRREVAELRYVWDVRPNHRVTIGGEYSNNRDAEYKWRVGGAQYSVGDPYESTALYLQDEAQLTKRFSLTLGARYDRFLTTDAADGIVNDRPGNTITPRGAAIFQINPGSSLKLLYGRAFRQPTVYELEFGDEPSSGFLPAGELRPEEIATSELVWEQRMHSDLLLTASVFRSHIRRLIQLQPIGELFRFENAGEVESTGGEVQLDYRRNDGVWSYLSYSAQHTEIAEEPMINSPRNLWKAGVSTSTSHRFFGAAEMRYESGRLTYGGSRTDSTLLTNFNFGAAITPSVSLTLGIRNAFDVRYATPGGTEHVQDSLTQDGRSFLFRVKVTSR